MGSPLPLDPTKMKKSNLLLVVLVLALGLVILSYQLNKEPVVDEKIVNGPTVDEPVVDRPGEATYPKVDFMYGFEFPGDWSAVPVTEFTAFYPATASWQWLKSDHPGSGGLNAGMGCNNCHTGQEEKLGNSLVSGNNKFGLEPDPIEGKEGYKNVKAQAAYDDKKFYLRVEWESERPGISHEYWRYNGEKWERWSSNKPGVLKAGKMPSYEDRFAVILDDKNVPAYDGANIGFEQVGCWQTCHNPMRNMPGEVSKDNAQAGIGKEDVRKYLLVTRTDYTGTDGNWADLKSKEDLDQLLADGKFLDLWMFRAARSGPIGYASDDWVFDYRDADIGGKNPFTTPEQPEFMFNEELLGFRAIPEDKFESKLLEAIMVKEETSVGFGPTVVPMDKNAEFKEGDIVMRRILQEPTENRKDIRAYSIWENGRWTVTFVRDLDTGNANDKALVEGNKYNIGFGVFDDHTTTRRHYVTLPMTIGIGVDADLKAVKI